MLKLKIYKLKKDFKSFLRLQWLKPYYKREHPYWVQKIEFSTYENREYFFKEITKGKDVLHIGCVDWPIFNPKNNLHIKLAPYTKSLEGFDIDKEGIENLKNYVNQPYYKKFSEVPAKNYDICLIPETIEHVDNVKDFLVNVAAIQANKFYFTAPNCFAEYRHKRNYYGKDYFIELVHPDHNCWYSPYTLKNQIEKYGNLQVVKVYLLEKGRMICCEAVKNENKELIYSINQK